MIVVDLGFAPTHRKTVHQIVGGCFVKKINKAGTSVRSIVNDDLGTWGQTTRLFDIERSFIGTGDGTQLASAVHVDLRDAIGKDLEPDQAPVGVGISGKKISQCGDTDRLPAAFNVGFVRAD